MSATDCLDAAALTAILENEAAEPVADHAEHLETCARCQQTLADLADASPCPDLARTLGRGSGSAANEPALERVMGRLKDRPPFPTETGEGIPDEDLSLAFLQPPNQPGVLGRFEVQEVIGRGGMGVVLRALDPDLKRVVAIKVLSPHLASSAKARQRFKREAQAAAAVCHDHVVTVHGVHEADGLSYLVMQFIAGESLQALLDRTGPLAVEEVVRIGMQTALGLAAAHARGLIHRDVKPANILLENDTQRVKITDFGLARATDDVSLTQDGVVAGTPQYMAPEQARGEAVDHRADLFSLGSVLYTLCAGRVPFHGATPLALLHAVNESSPVHLHSLNTNVPHWLEALIARLMAKKPEQRFQSAAEVAALLEGYLVHLRQPAITPAPVLPTHSDTGSPAPYRLPYVSSSYRVAMLLLLVLGLLGCASAFLLFGPSNLAQRVARDANPKEAPADPYVVWSVAVSPDGKVLAAGAGWWTSGGEVGVWDLATHKPLQHFTEARGVVSVSFSPNSKLLAFGSWTHHVRVLDWAAGKEISDFQVQGLAHVAFSPDGSLLATASEGQTLQLWDLTKNELATDLEGDLLRFHRVIFSPDGKRLLAGGGDWQPGGINHLGVWDVASKKQIQKLAGHSNTVYCVACSPDGKTIATGSVDRTIRLWDAETGRLRKTLRGPMREVDSLVFTADSKTLLSSGPEPIIRIWDHEQGKETGQLDTRISHVRAIHLSPDDKTLIAGGQHKTLKIFNLETREQVAVLWNGADPQNLDMDALPVSTPEAEGATRSYTRIKVIILVLALALPIGLFSWFLVRRSRAAVPEPAVEQEPAVAKISFACSACGAKLKAKETLAGKKVKCSQCAQAVCVPAIQAEKAN